MQIAQNGSYSVTEPKFAWQPKRLFSLSWRKVLCIAVITSALSFYAGFQLSGRVSERQYLSASTMNEMVAQKQSALGKPTFADSRNARVYDQYVREFVRRTDGETMMDMLTGWLVFGSDKVTSIDAHYTMRQVAEHRLASVTPLTNATIAELRQRGMESELTRWQKDYGPTAKAYSKALFRTVKADELIPDTWVKQAIRSSDESTHTNRNN